MAESEDVVERCARALFASNFHVDEDSALIAKKWTEWPQDRAKAFRQTRAVLSALREPSEEMIEAGYVRRKSSASSPP